MSLTFIPPSRTGSFDLVFSADPALERPTRNEGEADEAWQKRLEEWHRALVQARQTGDWSALIKPGAEPTRFRCRQVPGSVWRQVPRVLAEMGADEQFALLFRLAVTEIIHGPPNHKLRFAEHVDRDGHPTGLGQVLTNDTIDLLDRVEVAGLRRGAIVSEIGSAIWEQRSAPSPF